MKTLLVVEDDEEIRGLLSFSLKQQGYRVLTAEEGYQALELARKEKPDLILLDILLPGLDGLEVCRALQTYEELQDVPIIMLTAKAEELDVVLGLELGADDYVTKPFSVRELLSRVKAHLRRRDRSKEEERKPSETAAGEVITTGDITMKLEEYKVFVRGELIYLTNMEFELLKLLMFNRDRVLRRDYLLERIWGYDSEVDTRTVDVHVRYLRQKIEEDPANPRYIETVRGVGYCFRS